MGSLAVTFASLLALVAPPASAVRLERVLELERSGDRVTEVFRSPALSTDKLLQIMPESFWMWRLVSNEQRHREIRLVFDSVYLAADGTWAYFDGTSGHGAPAESGGLVYFDTADEQKAAVHIPRGSISRGNDEENQGKIIQVFRTVAGDGTIVRRESGLFLQSGGSDHEDLLTSDSTYGIILGPGERSRFATFLRDSSDPTRTEKLVVFDGDGSRVYIDDEPVVRYANVFFANNARYLFGCVMSASPVPAGEYFVLDLDTGKRQPIPQLIQEGVIRFTRGCNFVLFISNNGDPSFAPDASLYSLKSAPLLEKVWEYDSQFPIIGGAVSPDGEFAVLRASLSSGETELVTIDSRGDAVFTGIREPARVAGINVLSNGLVVTGAHLTVSAALDGPTAGVHIYVYETSQ